MLVVTDQHTVGVGRQRSLTGAGQAEEHSTVTVLADVGRAVHGKHTHLRQHIVHHGEHGLLDLAGILSAADDHLVCFIVHQNGSLRAGTVDLGDALEARCGNDGVILMKVLQLLGSRTAQQLVDKQVLAGQLIHNAKCLGVLGIGAGKTVKNKYFLPLQVSNDFGANGVKLGLLNGAVHLAPRNIIMDGGCVNDKLIVGAAAGVFTGLDHQRAGIGQCTLTAAQCVFGQLCRRQITIDGLGINDAQLFQSVSFHLQILLL